MNTKHTPGPWRLHATEAHPWIVECPTAHPDYYGQVCVVGYRPNATLIAKAPELADALREAIAIIEAHVPADALGFRAIGQGDTWLNSVSVRDEKLHDMRKALALATGQPFTEIEPSAREAGPLEQG